jgi:hypothetical protein
MMIITLNTVKPVLRGHLWDKENVALQDRWPLKRGSIHMKCSMMGPKNMTFKNRWLLKRGDCMDRFDCISLYIHVLIIPPLPEGGGGILFYLCPSFCPSLYPHSPKGEGGILFYLCQSVRPSVRPRYFSSHFSQ